MKFAIYSRKSVFTGKGESLENQIEMCKKYIHNKYPEIKEDDFVIYEDEGFSGKNFERPQFQSLLKQIDKKSFDCLVCYRLDRISRNVSDFSSLIEQMNKKNISFICIKEQFDTTTPMGKAMMYIASVFAQLERETIAERVRDNMLMLSRTGQWLGGTPPTGFESEKVQKCVIDGKIKSVCRLKIVPEEAKVVKMMYELFLQKGSVSGVSKYLIQKNIKSRANTFYSLIGIRQILSNPIYCVSDKMARNYFLSIGADVCFSENDCSTKYGISSYNKRDYSKSNVPRRDIKEWIISSGKHKGLISSVDWIKVQRLLDMTGFKRNGTKHNAHNDYALLSGLIYCKKCGSKMFSKFNYKSRDRYYYICNSKMRGGIELCDMENLCGNDIDKMVCEELFKYENVNSSIGSSLEKLRKQYQNDFDAQDSNIQIIQLNKQIKQYQLEIDNLVKTIATGNINDNLLSVINVNVNTLTDKINQCQKDLQNAKNDTMSHKSKELQIDILQHALESFKNSFDVLTVEEKRNAIKLLVDRIEWDGINLHIFIYGE